MATEPFPGGSKAEAQTTIQQFNGSTPSPKLPIIIDNRIGINEHDSSSLRHKRWIEQESNPENVSLYEEFIKGSVVAMDLLEACCKFPHLWENISACLRNAIVVTNMEGRILFAGPSVQNVLGFMADELVGEELSFLFTSEDLTYLYPNLLYLARNFRVFEDELMLVRKDGTRFIAFMVLRTCTDPDLGETVIVACIQDIHKQKQMEKSFQESHYEDLIKVADGIAHEIRNPLVGIGGFVNRLFKACSEIHKDHHVYYEHVITNLNKIESLVRKVELFARLPKPSFAPHRVEELAQKAIQFYEKRLEDRRIGVLIDMEDIPLHVDKDLVTGVFSILIENAMDAISGQGKILMCGQVVKNEYIVCVTDNGKGIPPEDLPYVFNPFFSTKASGTGMDLATVKRIIKSHGGSVTVKSVPGKETIFTLCFPLERRRSIRISLLEEEHPAETHRLLNR